MNNTCKVCDPDRWADINPQADPITEALAQSLAEASLVVGVGVHQEPQSWAEALRAEVAKLRQERDDWKLAFETSNTHVAALAAALEGLEQEMRESKIVEFDHRGRWGLLVLNWTDRLATLRTLEAVK